MPQKNVYFENLGCAKNQVDAEVMSRNLGLEGWTTVDSADLADLIIVNTCAFIESARQESIDSLLTLKKAYPTTRIIMAGCLSQRYGAELQEELTEASGFFGNRDLSLVGPFVKQVFQDEKKGVLSLPQYPDPDAECDTRDKLFNFPGSAYLKISEGCNHRCAYCAIPLIRGPLRSRPKKAVLEEAKRLIDNGIVELNLIAQDLAAYGTDQDNGKSHFCELLKDLADLDGDFRIRLLYIHPDAFPPELLDLVKKEKKIIPYFDIPFQHASEHILKPMKRTGNAEIYASLVERIRKELPESVIRTTIMLGFPKETEEDFAIVTDFVKRCRFNWMGSFTYSLEEGTEASEMTTEKEYEELSKVAQKRQKRLAKIQEAITREVLQSYVGKEYDVLIEEPVEGEDLAIGRIWAQAPDVDGLTVVMGKNLKAGSVVKCGIRKVNGIDLEAVVVE